MCVCIKSFFFEGKWVNESAHSVSIREANEIKVHEIYNHTSLPYLDSFIFTNELTHIVPLNLDGEKIRNPWNLPLLGH